MTSHLKLNHGDFKTFQKGSLGLFLDYVKRSFAPLFWIAWKLMLKTAFFSNKTSIFSGFFPKQMTSHLKLNHGDFKTLWKWSLGLFLDYVKKSFAPLFWIACKLRLWKAFLSCKLSISCEFFSKKMTSHQKLNHGDSQSLWKWRRAYVLHFC